MSPWRGQWQRRDTGDVGGTRSPFVTPAWHPWKQSFPFPSLHLPPFSKLPSFSQFPMWLPPQLAPLLSCDPARFVLSSHHSTSFSHSPLWLHTSDPPNHFTLSILKVCLFLWSLNPLLILFALLSTPWSDLPVAPSSSSLFSAPFLSPCRITLDIYSTAISQKRDENRFSFQQLLLSG